MAEASIASRSTERWRSLERRSAPAFLVAGVLFLLGAAINGIATVTAGYDPAVVSPPILLLGLVAALIGTSGLYPQLRERASRLAGLSLAVVAVSTVGLVVLFVWGLANVGGMAAEPPPPVALGTLVLMILAFALVGAAVLRTDAYPRRVGQLLVAEALALILVFAVPAFLYQGESPQWFGPVIEAIQGLLILGIGDTLRRHTRNERREPAADTAVR